MRERTGAHMARSTPAIVVIDLVALFVVAPMLVWPAMGAGNAAPVPDLAGSWARATFAMDHAGAGPGPRPNPNRLGGVPAYTNPILKPEAAKLVKERYET